MDVMIELLSCSMSRNLASLIPTASLKLLYANRSFEESREKPECALRARPSASRYMHGVDEYPSGMASRNNISCACIESCCS